MAATYGWNAARKDLFAGLTVAAISLPQAMAYALIAGIDPRFGLYSAIVVTAIASIFGSSSHLINGPTNAISLVVFSALAPVGSQTPSEAFEATFLLAAMVGVIQILIAVFKLGDLTRYISDLIGVALSMAISKKRRKQALASSSFGSSERETPTSFAWSGYSILCWRCRTTGLPCSCAGFGRISPRQ
jgi:MFS superfamily sulfate permease-like transporter